MASTQPPAPASTPLAPHRGGRILLVPRLLLHVWQRRPSICVPPGTQHRRVPRRRADDLPAEHGGAGGQQAAQLHHRLRRLRRALRHLRRAHLQAQVGWMGWQGYAFHSALSFQPTEKSSQPLCCQKADESDGRPDGRRAPKPSQRVQGSAAGL
jgi:hypothetical protein